MANRIMVLPSKDVGRIRVVSVPEDISPQEAYRYVTGLIAGVPPSGEDKWVEDVLDTLEAHGFESQEFTLGPPLD